ncbi:MAG: diguanylate cyclase [Gammaproteobacteria bacterium]
MAPERVLIVEDERIVALDLSQRLGELGYEIAGVASSGDQALRTARERRPDIVLMDIRLDGAMDGIDTARRLVAEYRVPVVFLTAHADSQTLRRCRDIAPFGYLVKPYDTRELHATLTVALARRSAELDVERSEERLRDALGAADMIAWEWDPATRRTVLSGAFAAAGGPLGPDALHPPWDALIERVHAQDRDAVREAFEAARRSGTPIDTRLRYRRANGEPGWMQIHARAFEGAAGIGSRLVGVCADVTARVHAEEQLRQAGLVYEATIEGIVIIDARRRIVSANPAFARLTGREVAGVVGRNIDETLYAEPRGEEFWAEMVAGGAGQWQGRNTCRRADGGDFPVWESVCAVRGPRGRAHHFVIVFSDISAVQRTEEQMRYLAHHDSLTGLSNRLLFQDRLDQALIRAARERGRAALLFLDLDGFKQVNDTLGHAAGDELLRMLADRIREVLRRADTAARLGGDEFVVVLADLQSNDDAALLAGRLLEALATPFEIDGRSVPVSASIGIGVYPDDGTDRKALLEAADAAMYRAKAEGRNRYRFHARSEPQREDA